MRFRGIETPASSQERCCRTKSTQPAISEERRPISPHGRRRHQLEASWKNGTTHVEFGPVEFIAKPAALVPPPPAHLTRFRGIFAPNGSLCAQLTPAGLGRRLAAAPADRRGCHDITRSRHHCGPDLTAHLRNSQSILGARERAGRVDGFSG